MSKNLLSSGEEYKLRGSKLGHWGDIFNVRGRQQENGGENCMIMSIIMCILHQVLSGGSNRGKNKMSRACSKHKTKGK